MLAPAQGGAVAGDRAHRIVWSTCSSAPSCSGATAAAGCMGPGGALHATMLALSGMLIAFNWSLYIWAVNAGHVVETALGYFTSTHCSTWCSAWCSCANACALRNGCRWRSPRAGVLWLTFNHGSFPDRALAPGRRSACNGLVRKLRMWIGDRAGRGEAPTCSCRPSRLLWNQNHGAAASVRVTARG